MIHLFLGQDNVAKDAKLSELKKKICPGPDALQFDCETLYAHKLDPETLKKNLITLPVFSTERLVIIKECQKLSPANKELVLKFLESPGKCTLVLDCEKTEEDEFIKKVSRVAKAAYFSKAPQADVFTLTRAIGEGQSTQALKTLSQLLTQGIQPLQIMGGIIWFWKKSRAGLPAGEFKKGLLVLQEADGNIKRSRLKAEHALELLVVKLCSKEVC